MAKEAPSLQKMAKAAAAKRSKAQKIAPKKEVKKPAQLSEEHIQDSDSEEASESDSGSEIEEKKSTAKPSSSKPTTNGKITTPADSSSESESKSSSEESSSEEEEDADEEMADAGAASAEDGETDFRSINCLAKVPKVVPYKAPSGFEVTKVNGNPEAAKMFKNSNLKGKQIWYFTAPASVPVSAIKSMSLKDAKDGKPVMEHKGGSYAFMQDSNGDKTYTKILVPSSGEEGYTTASQSIAQVFHLQQVVKLDGVVDDAPAKNHSCARISKPARPQPKGMKMRFRPLGFGSGELGNIGSESDDENDAEMENAPVAVPEKRSSETSKKRKHTVGKEKKSKHSSSVAINTPENKKLKHSKKKTTEFQTAPPKKADKPSASTNVHDSSAPKRVSTTAVPLPKSLKPPQISTTPIPSPKTSMTPKVSTSHNGEATVKTSKKKRYEPSTIEPNAKSESTMKPTELTSKEQRKIKKMKHKAKHENRDG